MEDACEADLAAASFHHHHLFARIGNLSTVRCIPHDRPFFSYSLSSDVFDLLTSSQPLPNHASSPTTPNFF